MYPQTNVNKNLRNIALGLLAFILLIIGIVLWTHHGFRITSTDPNMNRVATISPFINISFSQPLNDKQDLTKAFTSTDNIVSGVDSESPKEVRVFLKPMKSKTRYSITVDVTSSTNKHLKRILRFKTKDLLVSQLSKQMQAEIINYQATQKKQIADPILGYLPYGNLDFQLTATVVAATPGNSGITLNATILLTEADVKGTPDQQQATIAQYESEVTDYIKSIGLDPANYTINYQISRPSS